MRHLKMRKRHLFLIMILILIGSKGYSQQGLERYKFDGFAKFIFDEKTKGYKETTGSTLGGQITISYLDNTVEINSSENKRKFKLVKVSVESETFRTILDLDEDGIKYAFAIATKHFSLVGVKERIIYNRTR